MRRVGQKGPRQQIARFSSTAKRLAANSAGERRCRAVVKLRTAAKSNGFSNNLQISDGPAETPHGFVHWSADRHTQFYPAFPYAACLPARPRAGLFFAPDQPHSSFRVKRTIPARPFRAGLFLTKRGLQRPARTTAETIASSASIPSLAFSARIESAVIGFLVSRAAAVAIDLVSPCSIAFS